MHGQHAHLFVAPGGFKCGGRSGSFLGLCSILGQDEVGVALHDRDNVGQLIAPAGTQGGVASSNEFEFGVLVAQVVHVKDAHLQCTMRE